MCAAFYAGVVTMKRGSRVPLYSAVAAGLEGAVDLIERVFGVWPDGGDGSLELLVIVAVVVAVGTFVFNRYAALILKRKSFGSAPGSAARV
jgi:hypothetical protein